MCWCSVLVVCMRLLLSARGFQFLDFIPHSLSLSLSLHTPIPCSYSRVVQLCFEMMKKESDSCALAPPSSTPAPPGFTKSKSVCKENGPLSYMHEQNQTPDDFCEEQPPRRTSRKRSRPEFYAITTPRPPTPGQRRRGRPPRSGYQSPLGKLIITLLFYNNCSCLNVFVA